MTSFIHLLRLCSFSIFQLCFLSRQLLSNCLFLSLTGLQLFFLRLKTHYNHSLCKDYSPSEVVLYLWFALVVVAQQYPR